MVPHAMHPKALSKANNNKNALGYEHSMNTYNGFIIKWNTFETLGATMKYRMFYIEYCFRDFACNAFEITK